MQIVQRRADAEKVKLVSEERRVSLAGDWRGRGRLQTALLLIFKSNLHELKDIKGYIPPLQLKLETNFAFRHILARERRQSSL